MPRNSTRARTAPIAMPAKGYPLLKTIFDKIHQRDEHTLTLHAGADGNTFERKN